MGRIYAVLGWGIVALGTVHMLATARFFSGLTGSALWFFAAGVAMSLTGALNLLNRSYGRSARGVRWVCIGNNVVMALFAIATGVVNRAGVGEFLLVLGLMGGATVLSLPRRSLMG